MVNHIICPKCGAEIPVTTAPTSRLGRKSYNIPFTKVCKALRVTKNRGGSPNYSVAAKWLEREDGRRISPAYVWMRVEREADAREISWEELLAENWREVFGKPVNEKPGQADGLRASPAGQSKKEGIDLVITDLAGQFVARRANRQHIGRNVK